MHEAGARILQHEAPDGRPGDEVRRPRDQRAARYQLAQAILEVRYGVGDDRVYAPCRQPVDEREKIIAWRSASRLDQNPTAATERQLAEPGVTEPCGCCLCDLGSGCDLDVEFTAAKLALQRGNT
jgi:hypothetical protein